MRLMMCSGSSCRGSEGAHGFLRRRKQGTGVHSARRRSPVPLLQRRDEFRPWSSCWYHWRDLDGHVRSSGRHGTSGAHQGDRDSGVQSAGRYCQGRLKMLGVGSCQLQVLGIIRGWHGQLMNLARNPLRTCQYPRNPLRTCQYRSESSAYMPISLGILCVHANYTPSLAGSNGKPKKDEKKINIGLECS